MHNVRYKVIYLTMYRFNCIIVIEFQSALREDSNCVTAIFLEFALEHLNERFDRSDMMHLTDSDHFEARGLPGLLSWSWPLIHLAMLDSVACLSSHSLIAISIALLRSPFFPPRIVTTASRSLRSVSSERTMYILPKVYIPEIVTFSINDIKI